MNCRSVVGAMVVAGALLSAPAVFAAPLPAHSPNYASPAKTKLVKFTLRNDSSETMKVKAGASEMVLEPGKPMDVRLPEGEQIVAENASPSHEAGAVLATVSPEYSGNTLSFK